MSTAVESGYGRSQGIRIPLSGLARRPGMLTVALFGGFPLWWAFGLGELVWPMFGVLMAISLLQSTSVSIPRFASLWVIFLFAVVASGLMLEDTLDIFSWGIRLAQYTGAGLLIPYVLTHRHTTPARLLVGSMTVLFMGSVAGGYIGLVTGEWTFRSPMAYVLPAGLQANSFVHDVIYPGFADIERFLGRFAVTRPKAPFTYTNGWGAAMGVLFPFALIDGFTGFGVPRRIARIGLLLSVVPMVLSLNQGLWISLIAGSGYAALRSAGRGDGRGVLQLVFAGMIVAILIAATPLGGAFSGDLQNPDATDDRATLYIATIRELPKSPIIGFGGPRQVTDNGPPAGTHGQLWVVLFSHGAAGAISYFGFLGAMLWQTRRYRTTVGLWAHTVVLISFVQAPFYGHVPQQLGIIMVGAAVGILDARGEISIPKPGARRSQAGLGQMATSQTGITQTGTGKSRPAPAG